MDLEITRYYLGEVDRQMSYQKNAEMIMREPFEAFGNTETNPGFLFISSGDQTSNDLGSLILLSSLDPGLIDVGNFFHQFWEYNCVSDTLSGMLTNLISNKFVDDLSNSFWELFFTPMIGEMPRQYGFQEGTPIKGFIEDNKYKITIEGISGVIEFSANFEFEM